MTTNIRIDIASPPDRERLVAQLMIGNEQWAELNQEHDELELEIYPRTDGQPWVLSLDSALHALSDAAQRLRE
jgi:hypothetical protein